MQDCPSEERGRNREKHKLASAQKHFNVLLPVFIVIDHHVRRVSPFMSPLHESCLQFGGATRLPAVFSLPLLAREPALGVNSDPTDDQAAIKVP